MRKLTEQEIQVLTKLQEEGFECIPRDCDAVLLIDDLLRKNEVVDEFKDKVTIKGQTYKALYYFSLKKYKKDMIALNFPIYSWADDVDGLEVLVLSNDLGSIGKEYLMLRKWCIETWVEWDGDE